MRSTTPDGEQFELFTFEEGGYIRVPWEGLSLRGLTRASKLIILKPQGEKKRERFGLFDQLEMWPTAKKGPPVYRGASTLLPLRRRR